MSSCSKHFKIASHIDILIRVEYITFICHNKLLARKKITTFEGQVLKSPSHRRFICSGSLLKLWIMDGIAKELIQLTLH